MLDKPTQEFFDLVHEHAMSDFAFFRSRAGAEWFGELRRLAGLMPVENWRKYALWLIEALREAADWRDASRMTALFLNAFDNHMRLIWA